MGAMESNRGTRPSHPIFQSGSIHESLETNEKAFRYYIVEEEHRYVFLTCVARSSRLEGGAPA